MPRLFLTLALLTFLTGCAANTTYKLTFDVEDAEQRSTLLLASLRVVERRLARMGDQLLEQDIKTKGPDTFITLRIRDKAARRALARELTSPFTLRVMQQSVPDKADVTVEGQGSFAITAVTEEHLEWVDAFATGAEGKQGIISLHFTEEGRALLRKVFAANIGKVIGLFIRDKLVSKLTVETAEVKDAVTIQNIPSYEMARVFADDVNVGLHVIFTPAS